MGISKIQSPSGIGPPKQGIMVLMTTNASMSTNNLNVTPPQNMIKNKSENHGQGKLIPGKIK